MIVIVALYPFAVYSGVHIPVATLIALMVCLIPTTIEACSLRLALPEWMSDAF